MAERSEVVGEVGRGFVGVAREPVKEAWHIGAESSGVWAFEKVDNPLGAGAIGNRGEVRALSRRSGGVVAVARCAAEFGVEQRASFCGRRALVESFEGWDDGGSPDRYAHQHGDDAPEGEAVSDERPHAIRGIKVNGGW